MATLSADRHDSSQATPVRSKRSVRKGVAVTGAAGVAFALLAAAPPAVAKGPQKGDVTVVATGLNSPRHLSFAPNGDLYVAEAGVPFTFEFEPDTTPGAPPVALPAECDDAEHPAFGQTCLTRTSSITRLSKHGKQSRVVTNLPSLSNSRGEVNGAFDVLLHGKTLTIAVGLGGPPEFRAEFADPQNALLGTVIEVKQNGKKQRTSVLADLVSFEESYNSDRGLLDNNPVDLAWSGRDLIVTDAGANAAFKVTKRGATSEVAVFADPVMMLLDEPPFPGAPNPFPAQHVPTAAAQGPDGAWYVSELTGFPFKQGASTIWRVARNGTVTPYATGLTNVTDLAWRGRTLYAVQISDEGLLNGPLGSLVKVSPTGAHVTVADDLFAPYGLAITGGRAYVTVGSVAPGGSVIRVPLR